MAGRYTIRSLIKSKYFPSITRTYSVMPKALLGVLPISRTGEPKRLQRTSVELRTRLVRSNNELKKEKEKRTELIATEIPNGNRKTVV